jgi:Domain of unknown function (DUF4168)
MSTFGFTPLSFRRSAASTHRLMSVFLSLSSLVTIPLLSEAAIAQSISTDELQNYARSLLAIEPIRQSAYSEIKRILGSDQVPRIDCHRPDSLNTLSSNIRQIAIDYCADARRIAQQNDLSPDQFNAITRALQSNPDLVPRIEQEMIRLQQGSSR